MTEPSLDLRDDRFTRFRSIAWWNQSLLRDARVLVIGAGALGNEVIKNLSLLGVGWLVIADMDRVEASNLSRSVLYRAGDQGQAKAVCAARAARGIYPDLHTLPLVGNVVSDLGLGYFRWAQVVVGALDNREARVFLNRACAQTGRPWIDGGIEVLDGIVRGFAPPRTACYECTMGQRDWDQINQRRSCSLLTRQALAAGGTPTTPTTASIIGAIQAQEVVKRLHGLECLDGTGYVFEGLRHSSYTVKYPIAPDCPWHEPPAEIQSGAEFGRDTPLREIWAWAAQRLRIGESPIDSEAGLSPNSLDALDLSRELVECLDCPACRKNRQVLLPLDRVPVESARCPSCGTECVPRFIHSLEPDSPLLEMSAGGLGLPAWDVLWARRGEQVMGIELSRDRPNGEWGTVPSIPGRDNPPYSAQGVL